MDVPHLHVTGDEGCFEPADFHLPQTCIDEDLAQLAGAVREEVAIGVGRVLPMLPAGSLAELREAWSRVHHVVAIRGGGDDSTSGAKQRHESMDHFLWIYQVLEDLVGKDEVEGAVE